MLLNILHQLYFFFQLEKEAKVDFPANFEEIFESGGVFDDPQNSLTKSTTIDTVLNGDSLWACTTDSYSVVQGIFDLQYLVLFTNPQAVLRSILTLLRGTTWGWWLRSNGWIIFKNVKLKISECFSRALNIFQMSSILQKGFLIFSKCFISGIFFK